jgi:para-nitrobenzyl esterase
VLEPNELGNKSSKASTVNMRTDKDVAQTVSRRGILKGAAVLAGSTIVPPRLHASSPEPANPSTSGRQVIVAKDNYAIVETTSGKVRGYTRNRIYTYKGIPYGAPTGGVSRFMPPQKVQAWSGVRDAYVLGHISPQLPASFPRSGQEMEFIIRSESGVQGENCLVLNVWTAGINDHAKRPVMVWLHGGGFSIGSGREQPAYDGENLARRHDVVLVSVNHRLGPMGFLDLSSYGEKYAHSANVGMLDIVAALGWIRDNIGNFGGDPSNVMIFGQSGGGGKVGTLMGMPAAKGLFHKAAIESGSILRAHTHEQAQKLTAAVLGELGITASQIDQLQNIPFERLTNSADLALQKLSTPGPIDWKRVSDQPGWGPVVDPEVLPQHPFDPVAPSISADVPLIVGTCLNEFVMATDHPEYALWTQKDLHKKVSEMYGDSSSEIIAVFQRSNPSAKPFEIYARIATAPIRMSAVEQADRKAQLGRAPAYLYWFTWPSPLFNGRPGAPHGAEIPFVFDNIDICEFETGGGPRPQALAGRVSQAWVNLARTSDPSQPGLKWPAFSSSRCQTMMFDDICEVKDNPDKEERRFIQAVSS